MLNQMVTSSRLTAWLSTEYPGEAKHSPVMKRLMICCSQVTLRSHVAGMHLMEGAVEQVKDESSVITWTAS